MSIIKLKYILDLFGNSTALANFRSAAVLESSCTSCTLRFSALAKTKNLLMAASFRRGLFLIALNLCLYSFASFAADSQLPEIPNLHDKDKQKPSVPMIVIRAQLDKYFALRQIDPVASENLLREILKEDPNNLIANKELGYILLQKHELLEARRYFKLALAIDPNDDSTEKQIINIDKTLNYKVPAVLPEAKAMSDMDKYYLLRKTNPDASFKLLDDMLKIKPMDTVLNTEAGYYWLSKKEEKKALDYFTQVLKVDPNNKLVQNQVNYIKAEKNSMELAKKPLSERDRLFNQYYELKKRNPAASLKFLSQIIKRYPLDIPAQKEMAYALLKAKKNEEALKHFLIVERLSPSNFEIKMQIAYLLSELKRSREAYHYFEKVTQSPNRNLNLKANNAMTSLGGLQTKYIPEPWFSDVYFSPLYFSRFHLMIYPFQGRVGRYFGDKKQAEVYFINRTTADNRSTNAARDQLPQIFEDNVAIFSIGARYTPFENAIPGFRLYAEAGKAYDLIQREPYRRWRNDFRGGVLYGAIWGAPHEYVDTPVFPFKQVGSIYGDISYFTRYNDNIIGYGSIREGLRIAEYRTSEINLYLRGRGGFDKNQEFYNNFVEIGPGIELIPNNRYNFSLRLETLKGYYIKVDSPSPNPYGPNYHNTLAIAEFYALF